MGRIRRKSAVQKAQERQIVEKSFVTDRPVIHGIRLLKFPTVSERRNPLENYFALAGIRTVQTSMGWKPA